MIPGTPEEIHDAAAALGRERQYGLETMLGYGEDRITAPVIASALE